MCIFCSTFARFFGRMGLKPVQTLKTFETIKNFIYKFAMLGSCGSKVSA